MRISSPSRRAARSARVPFTRVPFVLPRSWMKKPRPGSKPIAAWARLMVA
jgi:hypothetical protein